MDYKLFHFDPIKNELQVEFPKNDGIIYGMNIPFGPEGKLPFFTPEHLDLFIRDHLPHTVVNEVKVQDLNETDITELQSQMSSLNIHLDDNNLLDLD